MAGDIDKQLAAMFAIRDDMQREKEGDSPKTEDFETEEMSADQDKTEDIPVAAEEKEDEIDPWDEPKEEVKHKKQKLNGLPYLFPGKEKNNVPSNEMAKPSVEPSTTEDEDDEYGKTQLLVEDEPKSRGYKLVALESGQECAIKKPVFLIGCQKNACDLVIPQDVKNHVVSRKHAYILIKNDKAYVKDISSNGTYIGTEGMKDNEFYRLPKDTEVELKDRQVIKLANIKLMFSFDK